MSRGKKKHDPFRTLIRGVIALAVVAAVFAGVFFGLQAYERNALKDKLADAKALEEKRQQDYQIALAEYQNAIRKGESLDWPSPKAEGWDVLDVSAFELANTQNQFVDRAELLIGGMMLINQWHPLPADFSDAATVSVGLTTGWKVSASGSGVKLFPQAVSALQAIITDAETQGLKHYFVDEGYRTQAKQQEYFDKELTRLQDRYTGDTLVEQAKKGVSYPGTSEYQTGFSFSVGLYSRDDPNVVKLVFQESDQGKWFTENCWKYGFIFRFPSQDFPNASWTDKSFKTGSSLKHNLYRWVGPAHAAVMRQMDLCLEEYVEYLMEHPHLAVYENGNLKYEVYRQQVGDAPSVTIQVPVAASSYQASLDNMGGVVTAFTYQ